MTDRPHILIAGAGIGGLAAALALLQRGFTVGVYEQAAELAEVGAGVQIAANGSRVLIALGLEPAMRRVVCEASMKEVRLWDSGQTWKLFDLGVDSIARFGAPYWFVHRGDLHRALLEAVRERAPTAIRTGARVTGFVDDGRRVRLTLDGGGIAEGGALICADGVHSRLRQHMFGAATPEFLGIISWRGLAPMAKLPAELRRPVGTNWVGPGGHVITYPLRGGAIMNFVGFGERPDWRVESWTEKGTHAECAADFKGWHPLVHDIIASVDQPYKWALVGRPPMPAWSKGRVTLLGDACHPMLPFLAQGANSALEDGMIVARCLDAHADIESALQRYQSARIERTTKIVDGSSATGKRFHNATLADPTSAADYVDREWQPEKVRLRYDWLFEYDATTVAL